MLLVALMMVMMRMVYSDLFWQTNINYQSSTNLFYSIGMIFMINSKLISNQNEALNYIVTFQTTKNLIAYKFVYGMIGFDSHLSDYFNFFIQQINLNQTHCNFTFKIHYDSFFYHFRQQYLMIDDTNNFAQSFKQIFTFTSFSNFNDILINTSKSQAKIATSGHTNLVFITSIYGLTLVNNNSNWSYLSINTWMLEGDNYLYYNFSIAKYSTLQYVAVTTLIFDIGRTYRTNYQQIYEIISSKIVNSSSMIEISQQYHLVNRAYFAINSFNFSMQSSRIFLFSDSNLSNLSSNLAIQQKAQVTLISFLFVKRSCDNASQVFFVSNKTCQDINSCNNQTQVVRFNQFCISCHYSCKQCGGLLGSQDSCLACENSDHRQLNSSNCVCTKQYGDVGIPLCAKCQYLLDNCKQCSNAVVCTVCKSGYEINLLKNRCQCGANQFMVNKLCLNFTGCLSASQYSEGNLCDSCNKSANFQRNSSFKCSCKVGSYLNDTALQCNTQCGDAHTTNDEQCDDGNINNSDGCSSICQIQNDYYCNHDNATFGISECVEQVNLSVSLLYCQKKQLANQVLLYFNIEPSNLLFTPLIFSGLVTVSIIDKIASVYYDRTLSKLVITLNYQDSIEGSSVLFNFNFSQLNILHSSDYSFNTTILGINSKMIFENEFLHEQIVRYSCIILSAFAICFGLFVSLTGEKMMGIQLVLPIQAIYFSMVLLPQINSATSNLKWLRFSNGFNYIQSYEYQRVYTQRSALIRMGYQLQHFLNINIMLGLFMLVLIVLLFFECGKIFYNSKLLRLSEENNSLSIQKAQKLRRKQQKKQKSIKKKSIQESEELQQISKQKNYSNEIQYLQQEIKNLEKRQNFILDRIVSFTCIIMIHQIIFGFLIQIEGKKSLIYIYAEWISDVSNLGGIAMILCGCFYLLFQYKIQHKISFNCNHSQYPYIYVIIHLLYIVVLALSYTSEYAIYICLLISLIPIVLIIVQQPYYFIGCCTFELFVSIFCQLNLVVSLGVYLFMNLIAVENQIETMAVYVIISFIFAGIVLTFIRMIKISKFDCLDISKGKKNNDGKDGHVLQQLKFFVKDLNNIELSKQYSEDSVRKLTISDHNEDDQDKQEYLLQAKIKPLEELPPEGLYGQDNQLHPLQILKRKLKKEFQMKMKKQSRL